MSLFSVKRVRCCMFIHAVLWVLLHHFIFSRSSSPFLSVYFMGSRKCYCDWHLALVEHCRIDGGTARKPCGGDAIPLIHWENPKSGRPDKNSRKLKLCQGTSRTIWSDCFCFADLLSNFIHCSNIISSELLKKRGQSKMGCSWNQMSHNVHIQCVRGIWNAPPWFRSGTRGVKKKINDNKERNPKQDGGMS